MQFQYSTSPSPVKALRDTPIKFSYRWGISVAKDTGGVYVYGAILRNYAHLDPPVTSTQFCLILQIAAFHYESESGRATPSITTIAQRLGVKYRRVIDLIQSLEKKREGGAYIKVERRAGRLSTYSLVNFAKACLELDKKNFPSESPDERQPTPPLVSLPLQKSAQVPLQYIAQVPLQKSAYEEEEELKEEERRTSSWEERSTVEDMALEEENDDDVPFSPEERIVLDRLLELGFYDALSFLRQYGLDTVTSCLQALDDSDGEEVKNPGGFVRIQAGMAANGGQPRPLKFKARADPNAGKTDFTGIGQRDWPKEPVD